MTPSDLDTMNAWIALIAIASLVQALAVVAIMVGAFYSYRRIEARIDEITRTHIAPASARMHAVLDKVDRIADRVRAVDARVSHLITGASENAALVATVIRRRFWPVVGVLRGLRAGIAALGERRSRQAKLDEDADQRFVYEGGSSHARTSPFR